MNSSNKLSPDQTVPYEQSYRKTAHPEYVVRGGRLPSGYEATGEFRTPLRGDSWLSNGSVCAMPTSGLPFTTPLSARHILRKLAPPTVTVTLELTTEEAKDLAGFIKDASPAAESALQKLEEALLA